MYNKKYKLNIVISVYLSYYICTEDLGNCGSILTHKTWSQDLCFESNDSNPVDTDKRTSWAFVKEHIRPISHSVLMKMSTVCWVSYTHCL